ncbi:hypothetical protein [Streptomyces klenkii]|uniref:hypothetical protein n=1 Tax=Streptomyces klenkii TaxID=1420899 RepID=UPI0011C3D237|nr:hypothetical protein [Streptomyces klenkii]
MPARRRWGWGVMAARRAGRPVLTPEQQRIADDLHVRAVALAAVQLGLESPQTDTEGTEN